MSDTEIESQPRLRPYLEILVEEYMKVLDVRFYVARELTRMECDEATHKRLVELASMLRRGELTSDSK